MGVGEHLYTYYVKRLVRQFLAPLQADIDSVRRNILITVNKTRTFGVRRPSMTRNEMDHCQGR